MFSIITLITTLAMCLYRGLLFFNYYDPKTNLFERTFLSFTLPTVITVVYVAAIAFGIYTAAKKMPAYPNVFRKQSNSLSLVGGVLFLITFFLYGGLKFVVIAQVTVGDFIICLLLVAAAFYAITLASYQKGKANSQAMGVFSMVCSLLLIFLIVSTFVGTTEMSVIENYMYYLLLLCGAALYFLYLSRNFLSNGNNKVSCLYGQLVLYFSMLHYLPHGVYLLITDSEHFLEGLLSILITASIAVLVVSINRLVYFKEEA